MALAMENKCVLLESFESVSRCKPLLWKNRLFSRRLNCLIAYSKFQSTRSELSGRSLVIGLMELLPNIPSNYGFMGIVATILDTSLGKRLLSTIQWVVRESRV